MSERKVESKFDERSMADIDELTNEQLDDALRGLGYDPAQVGYRSRMTAEICLKNFSLQAELAAANERIAALESRLEWEPVEDSKLNGLTIDMDGSVIWLSDDDDMYLTLPADIRLCRRRPQEQP